MKNPVLCLSFLLVFVSSCSDKELSDSDLQYTDGIYLYEKEPYSGKTIEYHDDEKKSISKIANYNEGKIRGEQIKYHSNGNLKELVHFGWLGRLDRTETYFFNGSLEKKEISHHKTEGDRLIVYKDIDWFDWCGESKRRKRIKTIYLNDKNIYQRTEFDQKLKGC